MQGRVEWKGGMEFVARTQSGYTLDYSGEGNAPSPMEAVLTAAGACSAIDVVMILEKSRQDVTGCVCELDADRAESAPRVFTAIRLHFVVTGNDLNEKNVERAVMLSAEKYCSVSLMLGKALPVSHSFEIRAAD